MAEGTPPNGLLKSSITYACYGPNFVSLSCPVSKLYNKILKKSYNKIRGINRAKAHYFQMINNMKKEDEIVSLYNIFVDVIDNHINELLN